jgi:hypothetical protein
VRSPGAPSWRLVVWENGAHGGQKQRCFHMLWAAARCPACHKGATLDTPVRRAVMGMALVCKGRGRVPDARTFGLAAVRRHAVHAYGGQQYLRMTFEFFNLPVAGPVRRSVVVSCRPSSLCRGNTAGTTSDWHTVLNVVGEFPGQPTIAHASPSSADCTHPRPRSPARRSDERCSHMGCKRRRDCCAVRVRRVCLQRQCVSSSLKPPFDTRPASDGPGAQCSSSSTTSSSSPCRPSCDRPPSVPMCLSPSPFP